MKAIEQRLRVQLSADTTRAMRTVTASTGGAASSLAASSLLLTDSYPWPFIDLLPAREVDGGEGLARAANLDHGARGLAVY